MKLLSCHIDNFGKLHAQDFSFDPGVNVILRENGWGKSTLAAFILAMFYGLKKDAEGRDERKRYDPWQGGAFGGTVTFSSGEKTYELTRSFGKTPEEDTAVLKETGSGREYRLTEDLGEKLFSIDKDSFRRTVFMGQNDDASAGTSQDITKRISNLSDNLNELKNYENAAGRLFEALNGRAENSAAAEEALKEEIRTLSARIGELQGDVRTLEEERAALREVREEAFRDRRAQEELQRSLSETIRLKETALQKEEYRRLSADRDRAEKRFSEIESRFPKGLPEKEELAEAIDASREQLKTAAVREAPVLTAEEEEEKNTLAERFPGQDASAAAVLTIARAERLNDRRKAYAEKKAAFDALPPEDPKAKKKNSPLLLILGIVVLVLGLDLAFYGYFSLPLLLYIGGGTAVIGLVLLILGIILFTKKRGGVSEAQAERARLRLETENDSAAIADEEEALGAFFSSYGLSTEKGKEEEIARGMFRDIERLEALRAEEKAAILAEEEKKRALTETIDGFLDRYGFRHGGNSLSRIFEIQNDMERYELSKAEKEKAEAAAAAFEEQHSVERIMNTDTDDIPGLEELENARAAAEEKLRASEEKEKALEDSIRTLSGSAEEKAEKEAALRTAEEALQEKETHRRLLEKTGAYLSAAREAQNDRYMEPLLTGFRYYYGLLSGLSAEQYSIDENAGVKLMELGEEREAGSLSTAYRDLIGLSLRLSLVDAMYTGEKPFLVMDDPFVNFDLKKTGEGKKFLEKVAEKYQIIYFTCHESRA